MDVNFASLGQMGISEDQMQAMFASRGIKLTNNDLNMSKSTASLHKTNCPGKEKEKVQTSQIQGKKGVGVSSELDNAR